MANTSDDDSLCHLLVQPSLWDTHMNVSEEDKELARARLPTMFNTSTGTDVRYVKTTVYI